MRTGSTTKLILRDVTLSDDISLRFNNSEWQGYPLFADNFINQIANQPAEEQIYGLFMNLTALGIEQPLYSNILEFFKAPARMRSATWHHFLYSYRDSDRVKSVDKFDVPYPLSWRDEERDISTWLGNPMQREVIQQTIQHCRQSTHCQTTLALIKIGTICKQATTSVQ